MNNSRVLHQTRLRVRYAETDQMGVVYYSNYLVWMEVGRAEYCRAAGIPYRQMEEGDGVLLAVAEAHCRYQAPARYDDEVVVETWIERAGERLVEFGYRMIDAGGKLLATGYTKHIFCTRDLKPARMPERYRRHFGLSPK